MIEICYRCHWAATDCRCPEGPLLKSGSAIDVEAALRDGIERAVTAVKQSPIVQDFVHNVKRGIVKWLRGENDRDGT